MEQWEWIEGFEGAYKVSDCGQVFSCKTNRMLSSNRLTVDGYVKVSLRKDGKAYEKRVHRIVAETFIKNAFNKETVNHIDGNKRNNRVSNLEWSTRSEQLFHAYKLGLKPYMRGEKCPSSKLTKKQVYEIIKTYKKGSRNYGTVALGKKYNVDPSVIGNIINGKTYTCYTKTCNDYRNHVTK